MAFPQYRIPVERLKEEWAGRVARTRMRRMRPPVAPSKITDNSEPWIRNPSSVAEFWEIACRVNETVRESCRSILPTASLEEVRRLFDRFFDPEVCAMALANPDPEVKALATNHLRELAEKGDPFSLALMEGREIS